MSEMMHMADPSSRYSTVPAVWDTHSIRTIAQKGKHSTAAQQHGLLPEQRCIIYSTGLYSPAPSTQHAYPSYRREGGPDLSASLSLGPFKPPWIIRRNLGQGRGGARG